MTSQRRGPWIQTFSGRSVTPLDGHTDDVCLLDIAHSLGLKCRYNGHVAWPYSVADHSVRVSRLLTGDRELKLAGLLHDAAEAYLTDVARPLKAGLYFAMPSAPSGEWAVPFKEVEEALLRVIFQHFRLPWPDEAGWAAIKHADMVMLATEKRDLMGPEPRPWVELPDPVPRRLLPWPDPLIARNAFINETISLGLLISAEELTETLSAVEATQATYERFMGPWETELGQAAPWTSDEVIWQPLEEASGFRLQASGSGPQTTPRSERRGGEGESHG